MARILESPVDYTQDPYTEEQVRGALAGSGLDQAAQERIAGTYASQQGTRQTQGSSSVTNPGWIFAVNLPSTYPDFAAMKQAGSGLVVVQDDANAADLIAAAKDWGVPVAIQVNAPPGITPQQYAARVAEAQGYAPDKLVLDVESAGKGYEGSEGWNFSAQVSQLIRPIIGDTSVAVTMEPNQDDYNYKAYTDLGAQVWVQSYTGDMTPTDPDATVARVVANGVDASQVIAVLAPGQKPTTRGLYASYGIPTTGASSAGVYGPGASGYPGGRGPGGPGTVGVPPEIPADTAATTTAAPAGPNWSDAFFGNLGLPKDVQDKVNAFFKQYVDQPDLAVALARQYIHTTPWFQTNFPGYFEGIRTGLFSDETGYRGYVNQANVYTMQYFNRAITTSEVESAMHQGISPEILGRTYEAGAIAKAQGPELQYELGAFGEGQQTPEQLGQNVTDLSRQQAGLGSVAGARIQAAFERANARMKNLFQGQLAIPNTAGQALAPPKNLDIPA